MKDYYFYHAYYSKDTDMINQGIASAPTNTIPNLILRKVRDDVGRSTKTDGKDWIITTFNFLRTI